MSIKEILEKPTIPGHVDGLEIERRIIELESLKDPTSAQRRELGNIKFTLTQVQSQYVGEKIQEIQADFISTRDELWSYLDELAANCSKAEENSFFGKVLSQQTAEKTEITTELVKRLIKELAEERSVRISLTERLISLEKEGGKNVE